MTAAVRYPVGPLLATAGGPVNLAKAAGVTQRTVMRWKYIGVDRSTADRAAVALGVLPCDIWGSELYELIEATS